VHVFNKQNSPIKLSMKILVKFDYCTHKYSYTYSMTIEASAGCGAPDERI